MSTSFDREELSSILEKVKPFVGDSDILDHVLFSGNYIAAYNLVNGIMVPFQSDFKGCVPFAPIYALVKRLSTEEIRIEQKGAKLSIGWGRSRSQVTYFPSQAFPKIIQYGKLVKTEGWDAPEDLCEGLRMCARFVSKDDDSVTRGLGLSDISITASDGQQIAHWLLKDQALTGTAVVNTDMVKGFPTEVIKKLYTDDRRIVFLFSDRSVLFGPILGEEFPSNIQSFFPDTVNLFSLPNKEMIAGLEMVGDFSGEGSEEAVCYITFGEQITIRYASSTSRIKEVLSLGTPVPEQKVAVNPFTMSKMLKLCSQFGIIEVPGGAALYGEGADKSFRCVMAIGVENEREESIPF